MRIFLLTLLLTGLLHADVTGQVTLLGIPKSHDITFMAKSYGCGESPIRHTENWKIGPQGELAEVVIWIVDPKIGTTSLPVQKSPDINQVGCRYDPHVQATLPDLGINFINSDPAPHNIHVKYSDGANQPLGEDVFNLGQGQQGMETQRGFPGVGLYNVGCDVHSWMQAWVKVLPASTLSFFTITDVKGQFKIRGQGLMDGIYKIQAWHPRFSAPLIQSVTVKHEIATINFQFDASKAF